MRMLTPTEDMQVGKYYMIYKRRPHRLDSAVLMIVETTERFDTQDGEVRLQSTILSGNILYVSGVSSTFYRNGMHTDAFELNDSEIINQVLMETI